LEFLLICPGAVKQLRGEQAQLHALLRGSLTSQEAILLVINTKAMLLHAEDKSEEVVTKFILGETDGRLTPHQATIACRFFTDPAGKLYLGGNGSSVGKAVVINTTSGLVGVRAEYDWIENHYGKRGVDWTLGIQSHGTDENGGTWDFFDIQLKDGTEVSLTFDISSFYGSC